MNSALYRGWVQHRRFGPSRNAFRYPLFMCYLDLAEIPGLFAGRWLWSARRPAPVRFRRADYLQPPPGLPADASLDDSVRELVRGRTGIRPSGPIRLLTHLRFFGYSFNPVTFYFVFAADDTRVETIVAEITNTPWKERHAYVLPVSAAAGSRSWRFSFGKEFHVSPFMPMDLHYEWSFSPPGRGLHVHMCNYSADRSQLLFDATLNLKRQEMTAGAMARALLRFPFSSLRVTLLIHWQALKLLLKRTPFFVHPAKSQSATTP